MNALRQVTLFGELLATPVLDGEGTSFRLRVNRMQTSGTVAFVRSTDLWLVHVQGDLAMYLCRSALSPGLRIAVVGTVPTEATVDASYARCEVLASNVYISLRKGAAKPVAAKRKSRVYEDVEPSYGV